MVLVTGRVLVGDAMVVEKIANCCCLKNSRDHARRFHVIFQIPAKRPNVEKHSLFGGDIGGRKNSLDCLMYQGCVVRQIIRLSH
jgi:hypothetical protein